MMNKLYSKYHLKSLIFIVVLCFSNTLFAQLITVEQGQPGETQQDFVERLVREVLIGSECVDDVFNITASTGVDFNGVTGGNNPNGIGFFDFGNASHNCDDPTNPFQSGVLITSGDALRVANPFTTQLSEGAANWIGNAQLDQIINSSLPPSTNPINSINATSIQFDFRATSENFSFRFFMASEEYQGTFECQFSDAFAFILTRPDGTRENLAVIPGTNFPITVTNVHNTNCPATGIPVGSNFFCEDSGANSFFAFDGYTQPFLASADVIVGEQYNIRLIVADDGRTNSDTTFDTGIFLQAGSFTGLGTAIPDFTVASGNPGCGDDFVTLDTGITDPNATFEWFKRPDTNPIPGETGSTLDIPATGPFGGSGNYSVTITFGSTNCQTTDEAEVQFVSQPIIDSPPENLLECETDGDGVEIFDLTVNTPLAIGSQTDVQVEYFDSTGNLIANPDNYSNVLPSETITIRISNNNLANGVGTCPIEDTFTIGLFGAAEALPFTYRLCDNAIDGDDTNGIVEFTLSSVNDEVLGAQDPTQFTVSYHINPADAGTGDNPLGPLYTNTIANMQDIFARVKNNNNEDCFATSTITLQVDAIAIANTVPPQLECDDNNDGFWDFDLDGLRAIVLGTQSDTDFAISFHLLLSDAQTSSTTNPLPDTFTNLVAYEEDEIFVRIENAVNTDCFATTSFITDVFNQPTATTHTYQLCDDASDGDDTNGFVDFSLTPVDIDSFILNGQDPMQFTVSYHLDQNDADNDQGAITNLYTDDRQIIARVENNDNEDCFATSTITLQVDALPVLDDAAVQIEQCDEFDADSTDAISDFNLTQANQLIVNTITDEVFTYYTTLADAESGTSPIPNPLSFSNADAIGNLVYVRVVNTEGCVRVAQIELLALTGQLPNTFTPIAPFEECDDTRVDDNITDGITVFDFSSAEASILGIFPTNQNISVDFYQNAADAASESNPIVDISNHVNTASPFVQEIFFRVENDNDNTCEGAGSFELRIINPTPRTDTESVDIILCDEATIGDDIEEFDLTQNEAFIFDGAANLSAIYFLDYDDALNNVLANEITTPSTYNNTNPTETIYVRVLDTSTGCFAIVDFDITVNPLPVITANIPPIEKCENSTDGFFTFNLTQRQDDILNGQDPMLFNVTYHTTQQGSDNLDLTEIPDPTAFINTMINSQVIYYAITNITTPNGVLCSNTGSFIVEVLEGAQANPDGEPLDFELCDDNIIGDGIAQFNFDDIQDEVLDGQDPADYTITYHFTEDDAINDIEPLPFLYENLTNPQTVWVRVSNNLSPDICFEVQPVPLIVNPLPVFELDELYILCFTDNNAVVPVPPIIDTGLSDTEHTFEWSLDGNILPSQTGSSLTPVQGGDYSVIVTNIDTSCTYPGSTVVIESEVPVIDAQVTSEAFSNNHTIEATTTNVGDFEFNLDNGPWQDNGVFENVSFGNHTVYARDINGCGITSQSVLVMDYPRFFTPNGDGNNDTWNIVGIGTQPSAKIYIFDRYGKLMKQLSPTGSGWDGIYLGNLMPTDDYWFTIEYVEPLTGETRQQTAHFTLKR